MKKTPNNTLVQILKSKKYLSIQENPPLVLALVDVQGGRITIVISQVHFEHF